MQTSPGQILMGAILGAALGLAGGWLLFEVLGADGGGAGPIVFEPAASRVEAAERARPADLAVPRAVGERQTAPAATRALSAEVDEARVEELVAASASQPFERPSGSGAIWGDVTVEGGGGLAGVVLRASPRERSSPARPPSDVGPAPPPLADLDGAVREAVAQYKERRARTFEAVSDASGAYRFEGLPEGTWSIEAYKRDYVVSAPGGSRHDVRPGTQLDFEAEPVLTLAVDVLMPDGTRPEEAVLKSQPAAENRATTFAWTPEQPVLRLTAGTYEISAEAGALPSDRGGQEHELKSKPRTVELQAGVAPPALVFELTGRAGIRGHVTLAHDGVTGSQPQVLMRPLGVAERADLEALAESDQNAYVGRAGDYAFLDLDPGRYVVGVRRNWSDAVSAHALVEVGASIVTCDLELPALDPSGYLAVSVTGSDGAPVAGVDFGFRHSSNGSSSSSGINAMRSPEGLYLITIPDRSRQAYFSSGAEGDTFTLTVRHARHGEKTIELARGQAELAVAFALAGRLEVIVAGHAGSEYEGRISIELAKAGGEDQYFWWGDDSGLTTAGVRVFEAVDPGSYVLRMHLAPEGGSRRNFGRSMAILSQELEVVSGPNVARMAIPPLYDVVVRHPAATESTRLRLSMPANRYFSQQGELENGVALFEDLPAGSYDLRSSNPTGRMAIEVPCGDVVFEAQVQNALLVTIHDESGAMAKAGLRTGDLIVGIDGLEFENESDLAVLYGRSDCRLRLLRGGRPLELEVAGLPWRDPESMGGRLEPTAR